MDKSICQTDQIWMLIDNYAFEKCKFVQKRPEN